MSRTLLLACIFLLLVGCAPRRSEWAVLTDATAVIVAPPARPAR